MKKGITMLEVIITVALISVVSILVMTFLMSATLSVSNIQNKYDTQSDARLVLDESVNILKTAHTLEITDVATVVAEIVVNTGSDYIYASNDVLYVYEYNGTNYDIKSFPFFHDDSFNVFQKHSDTELTVVISATKGSETQTNTVTIYLENMDMASFNNTITGTSGNAVKFTRP